ncbi:YggS family pyridoxal phosphate-dependent enzyme [uncultured Lacinutrix sp.]|uniref:YggS family pyridoxal phosphate-dependent enzyme n=1 Tax=uncultured Lacinutrix sp. TaxID=574032 RepID=UPI0026153432|nr:YggS family pyridoxal phosphate-dependent enzyme [uncultured Lacinutrix sp.]
MTKERILNNIKAIENRITKVCEKSGRSPEDVKLLLATKTVSTDNIKFALQYKQTLIGENKIQEVKKKFTDLNSIPYESHFIGHLQTNKVKELLKYNIKCLQSLDRIRLAKKLQNRLEYEDKTIDVFLQFNTSYEDSKFGMDPKKALTFAKEIKQLDRINIKGLMTIGLFSASQEKVRKCFKLLKKTQTDLLNKGYSVNELSMGMSGDLEIAIEEGATIIRIGSAIFGKRPYPDSYYWNENK